MALTTLALITILTAAGATGKGGLEVLVIHYIRWTTSQTLNCEIDAGVKLGRPVDAGFRIFGAMPCNPVWHGQRGGKQTGTGPCLRSDKIRAIARLNFRENS